jgi:hypothetical protein
MDPTDILGNGFAAFNGRYINPPFLMGAGGVELAAKEMTIDLQGLKTQALQNPGVPVALVTKGVSFGTITYANGMLDTSAVEGVDEDLVVRPFGRKGEFPTTRAFDIEAMLFHFGMEPVEAVGMNQDADGDGVENEVLVGELSALAIFTTNVEPPEERVKGRNPRHGRALFSSIGCADCHRPHLDTTSPMLTYSFPEVPDDPTQNIYYSARLDLPPAKFDRLPSGGIRVPMFSDLKRHDMGPGLAESFGSPLDSQFITARLWGIADTAPYLHDGRALTLTDAILAHGGEAQSARDAFANLSPGDQEGLLAFLRTLRTPRETQHGLSLGDM